MLLVNAAVKCLKATRLELELPSVSQKSGLRGYTQDSGMTFIPD